MEVIVLRHAVHFRFEHIAGKPHLLLRHFLCVTRTLVSEKVMFFHRRAEMSHVVAHNRSTRRTFRKSNNHEGTSRWACIRAEFAGGIASKGCLPTSLWESCTTPKQKYTASFFCSNYVGTDVLSHVISVYFFKNDGSRDCVDEDR